MKPEHNRKVREVSIVTTDRTDHYYDADALDVILAITQANQDRLAMTRPINLESYEEITYTLNNIVKTVISYSLEEV